MSSFNSLLNRNDQTLVGKYKTLLNNQDLLNETEAIDQYKSRLNQLKSERNDFSALKPLYISDINLVGSLISLQSRSTSFLLSSLEAQLDEYLNKTNRNHESSVALLRRLRQKLNTLDLMGVVFKFILLESFSTYSYISNQLIEKESLNVDLYGKIATLPIEKIEGVSIYDIYIGAESNGISGNPNDNKFGNPNNLINGKVDSYYEYFKLDDGPLILNLTFELVEEDIVNEIRIIPQNKIHNADFEINNIIFISSSGKSIQLKELCDLSEQTLKVRINEKESQNVYKFLPVKATKIAISFKQSTPGKTYLFEQERDFYSIAIKDISFYKNRYLNSGEISSYTFGLSEPFYSVKSLIKTFPKNETFFNHNIKLIFNNNSKQETFEINQGESNLYLLDGNESNVIYQYQMNRNDSAFDLNQSFKEIDYVLDIYNKSQVVLKDVNPNIIPFNEVYLKESLNLIQPRLAARNSNPSTAVKLGIIQGALSYERPIDTVLDLPINVFTQGISKKEINIYANNIKWNQVNLESELEKETWCLLPSGNQIKLRSGSDVPFYWIKWLLNPVMPRIHERTEGYYIEIDEDHDYDQDEIELYNFDSISEITEDAFPYLEDGWNKLSNEHLDIGSISVGFELSPGLMIYLPYESEGGTVWTDRYEIDAYNGFIRLKKDEEFETPPDTNYETLKLKIHNIKYNFYKKNKIQSDLYDTWMKASKVKGLFIEKNNFKTLTINETAYQESQKFDFLSGGWIDSTNNTSELNLKWFNLKYGNIISGSLNIKGLYDEYKESDPDTYDLYSEVEYNDGYKEFLTTEEILNDYIPDEEITYGENGYSSNNFLCYLVFRPSLDLSSTYGLNSFFYINYNKSYYGKCLIIDGSFIDINNAKEALLLARSNHYKAIFYKQNKIGLLALDIGNLFGVIKTATNHDQKFLIKDFSLNYKIDKIETDPRKTFKYSIDYKKGIVYLSHYIRRGYAVDLNSISIEYKVSNCILHYQLCKYLTLWSVDKENSVINLNPSEMKIEFNQIVKILYGQSKNFENIKDLRDYFSPIIYSLQLGFN